MQQNIIKNNISIQHRYLFIYLFDKINSIILCPSEEESFFISPKLLYFSWVLLGKYKISLLVIWV
mgnify:CR=1 FL=1